MTMPLPSLTTSSKSGADGNMGGSLMLQHLLNKGAVNINYGGGGAGNGVLASGSMPWLYAAIGAGVVWYLQKKK